MPFQPLRLRRATVLACAFMLTSTAWSITPAEFTPAYTQFMQAAQGDTQAIDTAAEQFHALLQRENTHPVLMAYAGAATAMKANTTMLPWKKMRYAEDGLAMLDKSLAMLTPEHAPAPLRDVPAALEVRFVAANTFLAVPGFMNRATRGRRLLQEVVDHGQFASAPLGFRGDVWMMAAKQAQQDQQLAQARKYLEAVLQAKAPQADAARAQLARM